MIRVIIADDHSLVRKGIKQIIDETKDIYVNAEASNGHELLSRIREEYFDIVLLDISMPGRNGIDILKQIKAENKKIQVLILSMHPEEQYAIRALKAGAAGYLTKESAPEELITAIKEVYNGKKYVSFNLTEKLIFELGVDSSKLPHENLSDREYEVMCLLASGKTVSEIAMEIYLSVKTISTYRSRILKKMNLKNNAEITKYAIENDLI